MPEDSALTTVSPRKVSFFREVQNLDREESDHSKHNQFTTGAKTESVGQRREEVAGMTWAELSEDLATWTIPATRTKNGIPHLVPLSQPASKILQVLRSDGPGDVQGAHQRAKLALVFPGERGTPFSGWSKAKSALDTASGVSGWWLHDLRRTLATGLQRLGVRLEVTEAVLNHLSGSRAGVVGIYQRHDWAEEKRAALDAWSAHLLAAAEGRLTAVKVLPFSRARLGEM